MTGSERWSKHSEQLSVPSSQERKYCCTSTALADMQVLQTKLSRCNQGNCTSTCIPTELTLGLSGPYQALSGPALFLVAGLTVRRASTLTALLCNDIEDHQSEKEQATLCKLIAMTLFINTKPRHNLQQSKLSSAP